MSNKKEDVIDKGIEKANDTIEGAINVVDGILDWITGPPYSAPEPEKKDGNVICHCIKK